YDPEVYYPFAEAIRGMGDMCRALETPVTGGNVSFHNESQSHAVFPTPTIGMLGLIDDVSTIVGKGFTAEGDVVALLGWHRSELGGSEYQKVIQGRITGDAPWIDINEEVRLQKILLSSIRKGIVRAAHDCSEGGLAVAVAEMAMSGEHGAQLNWPYDRHAADLFGEAQSRVVVTLRPDAYEAFEAECFASNVPLVRLGTVGGDALTMWSGCSISVEALRGVYEGALPSIMAS
ncbi:MAG: AIR synthase-related protein, partial [Bacteroidota bacterium]